MTTCFGCRQRLGVRQIGGRWYCLDCAQVLRELACQERDTWLAELRQMQDGQAAA